MPPPRPCLQVLLRWHLGRHLATWRRGVLISKLQRALGSVQQLQAAIESVREELQRKAAEVRGHRVGMEGWGRCDSRAGYCGHEV